MSTSGKAAGGPPTGPAGGDIAGTGTSTYPNPTLTALGAATGPIGSATVAPVVTIDTKGRVTALTSATITPGTVSVATATLNAAAIATLFSAPTTLIAAPGANRAITVLGIACETVAGNTAWQTPGAGLYYTSNIVNAQSAAVITPALTLLGSSAPTSQILANRSPNPFTYPIATVVNKAVNVACLTANPTPAGPIATSALQDAGAGYVAGDTGTIDTDIFDGGAAYVIDTVGALGIVLTYHLTAAGTGYTTADNPLPTTAGGAQPGIGTGFTVNVTALAAATGTLYITAYYATVTTH